MLGQVRSIKSVVLLLCVLAHGGWAGQVVPDMNAGQSYEYAQRRAGAEVDAAWKIHVTDEGLYRVTGAMLRQAGISNPQGSLLRLFCKDREVSISVSTDGLMSNSDYLLFYGMGHEGTYSRTNVYWLGLAEGGARWQVTDGTPVAGWPKVLSGKSSYVFEDKKIYRPFYRPLDGTIDHWFSTLLTDDAKVEVTDMRDPFVRNDGTSTVSSIVYGLSSVATVQPDHRSVVWMGNSWRSSVQYDGQVMAELQSNVRGNYLVDSQRIQMGQERIPGVPDPGDRAYLKRVDLLLDRWLYAVDDSLEFYGVAGRKNYGTVLYGARDGVWVLDVTDPVCPVWIKNPSVEVGDVSWSISFAAELSNTNRIRVISGAQVHDTGALQWVRFRDLAATDRAADYVVICPYAFRDEVYRLLTHRYLQGLRVAVAPISDVYNEFSYGIKDADAIKQFIGYAFHHWQAKPKYVLLAGDGSYDPKNNLQLSDAVDWIPVHLNAGPFEYCSMDGWFATVQGDDYLPDVAVGRLPARDEEALRVMVDKIIAYEEQGQYANRRALLVADNADDLDYVAASEAWVGGQLSAAGFSLDRVYVGQSQHPSQGVVDGINAGCKAVNYFGHGASDFWAAEDIFNNEQVALLANRIWPIFTMLTCENGNADEPAQDGLAEVLLKAEGHGAVACVAASALPVQYYSEIFAEGFYRAFASSSSYQRLGDVMLFGLGELWQGSPGARELMTYNLLGDPAQRIK